MINNKLILLVEDNPDDVELTLRAFKINNIAGDIIVKYDGESALDFFFGEKAYDGDSQSLLALILLDLKLPKISGLEVLKRLRSDQRTKLIPVVILTSSNEKSDLMDGYKLGCNSYIRKPVNYNQFKEMVRALGVYWLDINEVPGSLL